MKNDPLTQLSFTIAMLDGAAPKLRRFAGQLRAATPSQRQIASACVPSARRVRDALDEIIRALEGA